MPKHTSTLALVLCTAFAACVVGYGSGLAAAPARAPQPSAVALVNIVKLVESLDEYRAANMELGQRKDERQAQLNARGKEIEKVQEELDILPPENIARRRELVAQGIQLQAAYDAAGQALQRIMDLEQGDIAKRLYDKALTSIDRVAKREGYDLVLFDDRPVAIPDNLTDREVNGIIRSKRILFASERSEITGLVVAEMNNQYKAGPSSRSP